ncbi:hypothetical protein ASD44_09565 [Mesorhizobium sp. Root554]|uniref:hypothetical protein n=1 Tax=unclassified Mesorhizobium TaxID=325217 RepID=UPI0006FA73D3|nr:MULTISPECIES: hypothetical protein [unclassified Mesorhizobium]KQZ14290.1 hypothetical protein ASD27_09575 [Mesorhizobium sp. Root1471]KQZ36801.1 hypothetical protein ASD44_09565 [Mesorhizobium sp. Root554]
MNILGLDASVWFPVVTLILGIGLKGLFDYLADQRSSARERASRHEQRMESTKLRRIEFQRSTLLSLQESAANYARLVGRAHHHHTLENRKSGVWGRSMLGADLDTDLATLMRQMAVLKERAMDDELRRLVDQYCMASAGFLISREQEAGGQHFSLAMDAGSAVQGRIGVVLRSLDTDEDSVLTLKSSV